jgi:tRNA1(Val) A37 N6-methylase TrmN6
MTIKFKDIEIFSPFENDHIIKVIKQTRTYYEVNLLNVIKRMELKGTYVDVGANIGNHTIFFSKETNADYIHSFEISDTTCEILKTNLTNNNIKNVKVHNYGLSDNFRSVIYLILTKIT